MKKRKLFLIITLILLSVIITSGCSNQRRFNIEILNKYEFVDGFLENYKISECFYLDSESGEYKLSNPSLPEEYTLVIKSEEEYKKIFANSSKVNFEKEILVVYIYSTIYNSDIKITEIDLDEGELSIDFKHKLVIGTGSASMPHQENVVFKLAKGDFHKIEIDED